jgi:hypothetical protein
MMTVERKERASRENDSGKQRSVGGDVFGETTVMREQLIERDISLG